MFRLRGERAAGGGAAEVKSHRVLLRREGSVEIDRCETLFGIYLTGHHARFAGRTVEGVLVRARCSFWKAARMGGVG